MPSVLGALVLFSADLAVMALFTDSKTVLVVGIIVAGAFLGINNTLITEAVMGAAPVERPVASAAYSFVRFSGGAVAPYAAGKLGENVSIHAPFWMGAGAVLARRGRAVRRPPHAERPPARARSHRGGGRGGGRAARGRRPRLTLRLTARRALLSRVNRMSHRLARTLATAAALSLTLAGCAAGGDKT